MDKNLINYPNGVKDCLTRAIPDNDPRADTLAFEWKTKQRMKLWMLRRGDNVLSNPNVLHCNGSAKCSELVRLLLGYKQILISKLVRRLLYL